MPTIDAFAQFCTVIFLFLIVLGLTYFVTKWIARYQKGRNVGTNIEVIETYRIAGSKYVQILRVGDTYVAVAVCKDTVTKLAELSKDEIHQMEQAGGSTKSFHEILDLMKKKNKNGTGDGV